MKMCILKSLTNLDFCIRNLLTVLVLLFIVYQWVEKNEIRISNKGNLFPLD